MNKLYPVSFSPMHTLPAPNFSVLIQIDLYDLYDLQAMNIVRSWATLSIQGYLNDMCSNHLTIWVSKIGVVTAYSAFLYNIILQISALIWRSLIQVRQSAKVLFCMEYPHYRFQWNLVLRCIELSGLGGCPFSDWFPVNPKDLSSYENFRGVHHSFKFRRKEFLA